VFLEKRLLVNENLTFNFIKKIMTFLNYNFGHRTIGIMKSQCFLSREESIIYNGIMEEEISIGNIMN